MNSISNYHTKTNAGLGVPARSGFANPFTVFIIFMLFFIIITAGVAVHEGKLYASSFGVETSISVRANLEYNAKLSADKDVIRQCSEIPVGISSGPSHQITAKSCNEFKMFNRREIIVLDDWVDRSDAVCISKNKDGELDVFISQSAKKNITFDTAVSHVVGICDGIAAHKKLEDKSW